MSYETLPLWRIFNPFSVSGHFGRIFCLFFMARMQFPRMSYALTASFRVWQPPNTPFILSCQPMVPVYHVDAEEDVKDFRLLRSDLAPSEIVVFFLCPE